MKPNLLDIRGATVEPLSQEESLELQSTLKSIRNGLEQSLYRLDAATKPDAEALTFASCLTDEKSKLKCEHPYDVRDLDQRREFATQLHESLAALACEDDDTAQGILRQIPSFSNDNDSTRKGLATVLLARMKTSELCLGLAGLPAEYKAELERLAKEEEAERQQAAKAASAVRQ